MLVVSAVHIISGWVWHTAYQARRHWSLKREGALVAAAAVAVLGVVDGARSALTSVRPQPDYYAAAPTKPMTVSAQPVLTEGRVDVLAGNATPAINPDAPTMVAAGQIGLDLGNVAPEDMLPPELDEPSAEKIMERVEQHDMTASISPKDGVEEMTPAAVKAPVKSAATRPAKRVDQIAVLLSTGKVVKTQTIVKAAPAKAAKPTTKQN